MDKKTRRLERLEEEAVKIRSAPEGRTLPSDRELATATTLDEYYAVWERHGWSRSEVEAHEEWRSLVEERCEAAGFENWMIIKDMIEWFKSTGRPNTDSEMEEALRDYPGPEHWGTPRGSVR
jgi:hypothetical protein